MPLLRRRRCCWSILICTQRLERLSSILAASAAQIHLRQEVNCTFTEAALDRSWFGF
jgi:hypothetical protein